MIIKYDIHCFERELQITFPDDYEDHEREILLMLDAFYDEWHNVENIEDPEERFAAHDSCLEEHMMERLSETYAVWTEWKSVEWKYLEEE